MIKIIKYEIRDKEVWNDFVESSKNGTFMLKRDFIEYHSDRFVDFSLMFYEDDELIALLPASLHNKEVRSHGGLTYGGFIVNEKMKQHRMNDCFDALKQYLSENGIEKLIYKSIPHIYHRLPSEEDLYSLFVNGAKLVRRDVSTAIYLENQLKMPKGRKAQISRAKRENVIVQESKDYNAFIELENQVLTKHGAKAVHSAEELKLLNSRFPENIRLFIALQDDELLAATLIFEYENLVHTQYMASSDKGREIGALDLLISALIEQYKPNKKYFDFGISTENDGQILNSGLISQKEGFGARSIVYDFYELSFKN